MNLDDHPDRAASLQKQNERLRKENEMLSSQIEKMSSTISRLSAELQTTSQNVLRLNEKIVTLNGSDEELKEAKKLFDQADTKDKLAEASLTKAKAMETASKERERETDERQRYLSVEAHRMAESEVERRKDEIRTEAQERIMRDWYQPAFFVLVSITLNVFLIVSRWEVFANAKYFMPRFMKIIAGIWQVAWPAVLQWTNSLVMTIIIAVVAGSIVAGFVVLCICFSKKCIAMYESKIKGRLFFCGLADISLVAALFICTVPEKMTWITCWILFTFGTTLICNLILLIKKGHSKN